MSVRQPACIFVLLVPVVLGGCTALHSMSLQAAGPNVFAVPSSMPRGDQMPRSFNLCTSVCFLVMCRAAGLMGESPRVLPAFGQGRLCHIASLHHRPQPVQQAVG